MKTNSKLIAIALLSAATFFGACSKKDDVQPTTGSSYYKSHHDVQAASEEEDQLVNSPERKGINPEPRLFETMLCANYWKVNSYNDGVMQEKRDQTPLFRDYTFQFNKHHVIIVRGPERDYIGKWNTNMAGGKKNLILNFGWDPILRLNDQWVVVSFTPVSINLVSTKNQGQGSLIFEAVDMSSLAGDISK
jgi:hypothetical protein